MSTMKVKLKAPHTKVLLQAIEFYNDLFHKRDFEAFFRAFQHVEKTESFDISDTSYAKFREAIAPMANLKSVESFSALEVSLVREEGSEDNILSFDTSKARRIISVLDAYSRALMGQFHVVLDDMRLEYMLNYYWDNPGLYELHCKHLQLARVAINPELSQFGYGGSYGITSPQIPDESRIAYEMLGCIRHWVWQESDKSRMYGVDSYLPLKCSGVEFIERI